MVGGARRVCGVDGKSNVGDRFAKPKSSVATSNVATTDSPTRSGDAASSTPEVNGGRRAVQTFQRHRYPLL